MRIKKKVYGYASMKIPNAIKDQHRLWNQYIEWDLIQPQAAHKRTHLKPFFKQVALSIKQQL